MVKVAWMPGFLTKRVRSIPATRIVATLIVIASAPPTSAALRRPLADALPPGKPSCHARVVDAAEFAANPQRRVEAIAIERSARDVAAERKWSKLEEFDGTAIVSAALRVRFRGDKVTHAARLECFRGDGDSLVCESPACVGGELRISGEGPGAIKVSIGGTLKSGRFIGPRPAPLGATHPQPHPVAREGQTLIAEWPHCSPIPAERQRTVT